ncbi:MAG: KamA family radical SAM protein [Candidatus Odinarchaeota archaeon]
MIDKWQKCWDASPELYIILKESSTVEDAREKVIRFVEGLSWSYRRDLAAKIESWDYILLKEAIKCFKNIISPRNERLANCSPLEYLWKAAVNGDSDVENGFIEEFYHLFNAIKGRAKVYPLLFLEGLNHPDFDAMKGRKAGIARSNYLDDLSRRMERYIQRYPTGFQNHIIEERIAHKKKMLDILGGSDDDWLDYRWQFKHVFKDEKGLELIKKMIKITPEEEEGIRLALENSIPFGVTPHYLHLMDPEPSKYDQAVRNQVFPPPHYVRSVIASGEDRSVLDFMREHDTSPIDLVTRRYPRVAILKPYDSCPQICVYCQRNWEITSPFMPHAMAPREKIDQALQWFAEHEEIMDVLITGGDPFVMGDDRIEHIIQFLTELKHVRSIRFGTRVPITAPMRITEELCEIFSNYYEAGKQTICIVTHFSHPYEITFHTAEAIKKIKMQGIHVYNQEVFTFSNSRRFETVALRIAMKQIGVDPYYNFNMKGKEEMTDYAVPVARILQERKEEARLIPGIYRGDEPVFNVPFLGKNHLRAWQDHEIISILPDGRRVYSFHPWEKNIAKVKPYIYTDVNINSYLEKLEAHGENPEDYKSIWYYY